MTWIKGRRNQHSSEYEVIYAATNRSSLTHSLETKTTTVIDVDISVYTSTPQMPQQVPRRGERVFIGAFVYNNILTAAHIYRSFTKCGRSIDSACLRLDRHRHKVT